PQTGRPGPPPPGTRGPGGPSGRPAGAGAGAGTGRPPGGGAGRPPGGGFGAGRPGGYTGRPGGGQFPRSQVPGAGVGRGGPGGGPGGRGGPGGGRPRPQRRRRRRRSFEELEPTQLTTYTPSEAPVPEGEIIVERGSTAQDLGPKLNRTAADVVRFLLQQGEMVTATMSLSDDMIELFAAEVGADVLLVEPGQEQEAELQALFSDDDDEADLRPRPPVITVMGHVDHGKTLLLDRIRETNVVAGEAGGITQHIGAYQVERNGQLITFIDTPGHEAFTAMRARGAEVTDIAVLVVAADDGVMPQTVEANLDVGRGPVATVLVESGSLRVGDPMVAGAAWGRVRALIDDKGDNIKEAGPSSPVQVLGLSDVPFAGDEFRVAPDDKTARTVAEAREQRYRFAGLAAATPVVGTGARLEDIFEQIQRGETARLDRKST